MIDVMKTKEEVKEKLIELNYYLSQAMINEQVTRIQMIRIEMNSLIKLYLLILEDEKTNKEQNGN